MNLCLADLRQVPVFEDLDEKQLNWLIEHGTCLELVEGDVLWEEGQKAKAMFVVLQGLVRLFVNLAGQSIQVSSHRWGGVTGVLPYSRMEQYPGKMMATEPCRVLSIDRERFPAMLQAIPELGYRLVGLMSDRVRERTKAEAQREKMMALGKLSAGLAHELNNPAAAVQRSVADLTERLRRSNALVLKLAEHGLGAAQMRAVVELRESAGSEVELSPVERGAREEDLGDWLETQGVEEGWMMAETFVDAGFDVSALEAITEMLPPESLPDALAWIESGMAAKQLLSQVASAAGRVSNLVRSVKAYSHMDENPDKRSADLHHGLDETLTMLAHSFKKKSVRLERAFASDLPSVPVFVSELNQVWTNLIDNALDAVGEGGCVRVATEHDLASVFVRIIDDGEGIPEEARGRIFEPFFTTKGVGEGTGLGLDVVQRIVLQHDGEITCESRPGRTEFVVRLPKEATG